MPAFSQRSQISGIQDPARAKLRIEEDLSSLMPHMLTLNPTKHPPMEVLLSNALRHCWL